jgi:predicted metal-binding membrane protein
MLFAMMAPMTLPALYRLRSGSFARLRWAMYALFVLGYGAVWMAAGLVLQLAEVALRGAPPQGHGAALAVGLIAVIWQSSPFKQRCLNRCHAHRAPAAFGGAAARGALASGLEHGVWCVGSCWAMMWFPMLLPTGHLVAMAAVTLLMFCERLDPPATPAWRMRGLRTALRWARLQLVGARASARPAAVALPVSRGAARRRAP